MRYLVVITLKSQDEIQFRMSAEEYIKLNYQLLRGTNQLELRAKVGETYSSFHLPICNVLYVQAMEEEGEFKGAVLAR